MSALFDTFTKEDLQTTLDALGTDVFFVQVGAMDGRSFDPIHPFVKKHGWHGLLVEPMPHLQPFLQKNYEGCTGLTFVPKAITDYEGMVPMSSIDPEAAEKGSFARSAYGLATVMPDRGVLGGHSKTNDDVEEILKYTKQIEVPCCRLTTLLTEYEVKKLDLLVIDTEGADWMVARQLPMDQYRPRIIYLEFTHLPLYEKTACIMHFRNHGYRIYLEKGAHEDFLAIR